MKTKQHAEEKEAAWEKWEGLVTRKAKNEPWLWDCKHILLCEEFNRFAATPH